MRTAHLIPLFFIALFLSPLLGQQTEHPNLEREDQPLYIPDDEKKISTQAQINTAGGRVYVYVGRPSRRGYYYRRYPRYRYGYYYGYPYAPRPYNHYYYPYQRPYYYNRW